jgi:hypothetical protein
MAALGLFNLYSAQVSTEFFRLFEFLDGCSHTTKLAFSPVSSCKYVL